MQYNKYQTEVTEELLSQYPKEVQEQFVEYVQAIPFIQNLISKDRKYAKDLERDSKGRIIIDTCNPHILEDMDYFRQTALHFKKYEKFTTLAPNSNPNSEYGMWIRRERDRCWDGMVRESDGEWVTGFMYWYMNYCPIMLSEIREGTSIGDRIESFPETWEGIYW